MCFGACSRGYCISECERLGYGGYFWDTRVKFALNIFVSLFGLGIEFGL